MTATDDTWTPPQAEQAIRATTRQLHRAQVAYRNAGDALVKAKHAFRVARTRAAFSPDCPKVARGEVTVGDRDNWIDAQCANEALALFSAEIVRENAVEALRTMRLELQAAMSLNASAREAYRGSMTAEQ